MLKYPSNDGFMSAQKEWWQKMLKIGAHVRWLETRFTRIAASSLIVSSISQCMKNLPVSFDRISQSYRWHSSYDYGISSINFRRTNGPYVLIDLWWPSQTEMYMDMLFLSFDIFIRSRLCDLRRKEKLLMEWNPFILFRIFFCYLKRFLYVDNHWTISRTR